MIVLGLQPYEMPIGMGYEATILRLLCVAFRLGVKSNSFCEGYRAQKSQHMNAEEPKSHLQALNMSYDEVWYLLALV